MRNPYSEFEQTTLWETIDAAVSELERNRDVELSTAREHVIGYLCHQLAGRQVVTESSLSKSE